MTRPEAPPSDPTRRFSAWIGIDYSGAATPDSRLPGLATYRADNDSPPARIDPPCGRRHWTRRELFDWLDETLAGEVPVAIGIDHALSFPEAYFARYRLANWEAFLEDFCAHWPTTREGARVDDFRPRAARVGDARELRLCDRWTAGAKSVFQFDVQGSVAKSTHAGLPFVAALRATHRPRLHVWPFDGFEVPAGRSLLAEVFPSRLRRRYSRGNRRPDEQDAYAVAAWLSDMDRRGVLETFLNPPLTDDERSIARREGWILGVY